MSEAAVQLDEVRETDLRRLADQMLETRKVEYVDEGVLLVMNPPGPGHRRIVRRIVTSINRAYQTLTSIDWAVDTDFQWDLPDGSGRFYIPDAVVIHPDARTLEEERAVERIHQRPRRIPQSTPSASPGSGAEAPAAPPFAPGRDLAGPAYG